MSTHLSHSVILCIVYIHRQNTVTSYCPGRWILYSVLPGLQELLHMNSLPVTLNCGLTSLVNPQHPSRPTVCYFNTHSSPDRLISAVVSPWTQTLSITCEDIFTTHCNLYIVFPNPKHLSHSKVGTHIYFTLWDMLFLLGRLLCLKREYQVGTPQK